MGAAESRLFRKHKTVSTAHRRYFHPPAPANRSVSLANPVPTDITAIFAARASLNDNHLLTVTERQTRPSHLSRDDVLSGDEIHSENDDIPLKDTIPAGGHQLLCDQPQHADWFSKESETLRENLHNLGLLGNATDSYSEDTEALNGNANGGEADKPNTEANLVGAMREEDEEDLSSISSLLNLEGVIKKCKLRLKTQAESSASPKKDSLTSDLEALDKLETTASNTCQVATTEAVKRRNSNSLGFRTLPDGEVVFTAYLPVPGQNEFTWSRLRQRSERNIRGLRQQFNCDIKLYDKPARHRALPVHKLRIRGANYRDVMRCKNALPDYIANSLITSKQHCDDVINKTVITLAKGAIGPDVFHNFKALLQILRSSIEKTVKMAAAEEHRFQETIINTIAEFAKNLPDAQKIEILKFILNFDPLPSGRSNSKDYSKPMVKVLVKTMLTVATQYQTVAISNAIDSDFLRLLLHGVAVDPDASIRVFVQKILHALIDRHGNAPRLLSVKIYPMNEVTSVYKREKPSRQDILFMKKTGFMLTDNLYHQLLDPSNKVDNLEHLMCTIGLVALEMGAEEVIVELFRLVLAVQQVALSTDSLPLPHLCAVHAILACVMSIVVPLAPLPPLVPHVEEVISRRQETAPYLLPDVAFNRKNTQETYPAQLVIPEELLFCKAKVSAALADADFDATTLETPYPAFDPLKALPCSGRGSQPFGMRGSDYNGSGVSEYGTMQSTGQRSMGNYPSRTQTGLLPPQLNDPLGGNLAFAAARGPRKVSAFAYMATGTEPRNRHSDSFSSISITASCNSTSNQQSRASGLNQEFLSFDMAHRILHESPEAWRQRKLMESGPLTQAYSTLDFDGLCAQNRRKVQTAHMNMAEVFSDLSSEVNRRSRLTNSRSGHHLERGFSLLRGREKEVGGSSGELNVNRDSADEDSRDVQKNPASWDSNFISLFVA
nr:unnamed protein product [Spirometra erinaceieuropaei]